MEPKYTKKMRYLNNIDPKLWQAEFNDWHEMTLKQTCELYEDYVLVAVSNWMQFVSEFGGAPAIQFFVVDPAFSSDLKVPEMPDIDY